MRQSKLDFTKLTNPKVAELLTLEALGYGTHKKHICLRRPTILRSFVHATRQVLLLDECSMLDKMCFEGIQDALSCVDDTRRPEARTSDPFGSVSLILFGDFKQELRLLIHSRISVR